MNWIFFDKFGFRISLCNPIKTLKQTKYIFKRPKLYFRFCSPKTFPLMFGFPRGKIFDFVTHDVFWKDKYDTPRFEDYPRISITFFNSITLLWYWGLDDVVENDQYWEQMLWYLNYFENYGMDKPNIFKAKKEWPWMDGNEKSTWNNKYLRNERMPNIYEICKMD